jgi:hypothetical protein
MKKFLPGRMIFSGYIRDCIYRLHCIFLADTTFKIIRRGNKTEHTRMLSVSPGGYWDCI